MGSRLLCNVLLGICTLTTIIACMAQDKNWSTVQVERGNIKVNYSITDILLENNTNSIFIQDTTTTIIEGVSLNDCILVMKDIPAHKYFTGHHISQLVKTISDNEWIIYYYSKNPWPIKNSDCVMRMLFDYCNEGKKAIFTLTASPYEYDFKDVNRSRVFNITYYFTDIGNGKVEVTMIGSSIPPVKVPLWLIKAAFPKAPANTVKRLVNRIKEY